MQFVFTREQVTQGAEQETHVVAESGTKGDGQEASQVPVLLM